MGKSPVARSGGNRAQSDQVSWPCPPGECEARHVRVRADAAERNDLRVSVIKGRGTLLFSVGGFLLSGLLCAGGLHAQDAAEAARQEQARKAAESKTSHHVYTEDDLKRAKILTPEDQAKVAARKNNPSEKKEEQAKGAGESAPGEESLGEVARRYRKEKAEREAARATGQGIRSQFPMKLPEATMAAPKMLVQPKTEARAAGSSRRSAAGSACHRLSHGRCMEWRVRRAGRKWEWLRAGRLSGRHRWSRARRVSRERAC